MVFSSGVMSRAEALEAMASAPPWSSFEILNPQVVELTPDSGVLVYRIVNHGPALMRSVNIRLLDENGEHGGSHPLWPPLPIPEIHVAQALHLTLSRSLGDQPPRSAVLSWRDGRASAQQRTFWLTWQRVT
jgi:hypothetical protein